MFFPSLLGTRLIIATICQYLTFMKLTSTLFSKVVISQILINHIPTRKNNIHFIICFLALLMSGPQRNISDLGNFEKI